MRGYIFIRLTIRLVVFNTNMGRISKQYGF